MVSCQPAGAQSWRLGTRLDRPENFWGLREFPKDWANSGLATALSASAAGRAELPEDREQRREVLFDRVTRELDLQVKKALAESVLPLQQELAALKDKLARRETSRFEVSLSGIPPELESQLELRLKKDLGPRVLDEARQQAAQLLAAAGATIHQKTNEGYEDFVRRAGEELKIIEKRAREASAHISENTEEHLRRGLQTYQQQLVEGGNSLKHLSEELLEYLKHNLDEEHNARRGDLEQLRSAFESESTRLHEQIQSLHDRIARLDESAQTLESGLDQRLSQMASNTVKDARNQLESVANNIHDELATKSVKVLARQLDDASGNMKAVQKGIVESASESLKMRASDALQAFERSTQELAQLSVARCQAKLTRALNALMKSVSEEFQSGDEG